MTKKILKNELLFHTIHGLCRVVSVTREASSKTDYYELRPVSQTRSKARFTIPRDLLESSGFNRLVSAKEAAEILEYLKTGDKKKTGEGNAWVLAVTLRAEARSKEVLKDKRKAQQLNHLVKSLVGEMAIVLQATAEETLEKIQENLKPTSKINPLILAAFASASDI